MEKGPEKGRFAVTPTREAQAPASSERVPETSQPQLHPKDQRDQSREKENRADEMEEKAARKQERRHHRRHHHHASKKKSPEGETSSKPNEHATFKTKEAGTEGTEEAEDWGANQERIERLRTAGANANCADCGEGGTQWAAVNLGVFLCIRCAGIHRSLGTDVSKVKSTGMDRWTRAEVRLMATLGNQRARELYLNHPQDVEGLPRDHGSDAALRRFILRKYVDRAFARADLTSQLTRIYREVGYPQSRRTRESHRSNTHNTKYYDHDLDEEGEDRTNHAYSNNSRSGKGKKVDATAVVRALYGDATTAEFVARIENQQSRPVASIESTHGTFGIVNVDPAQYAERAAMVLQAFGVKKTGEVLESS